VSEILLVIICSCQIVLLCSSICVFSKKRANIVSLKGILKLFICSTTVVAFALNYFLGVFVFGRIAPRLNMLCITLAILVSIATLKKEFCVFNIAFNMMGIITYVFYYYSSIFVSGWVLVNTNIYCVIFTLAAVVNAIVSTVGSLKRQFNDEKGIGYHVSEREWHIIGIKIALAVSMISLLASEYSLYFSTETAQSKYYNNQEFFEGIRYYIDDNYGELNKLRNAGYPGQIILRYINQRVFYVVIGGEQRTRDVNGYLDTYTVRIEDEIEIEDRELKSKLENLFYKCRVYQ